MWMYLFKIGDTDVENELMATSGESRVAEEG